jgi:malate dehydrogenase (oxaloacetate-decarboxylating)(NADP+)
MKVAAAHALAALAHEEVPDSVARAYGVQSLRFGPEYLIPKPLDPRVLLWVAPAVAKAAMESGVARRHLDLDSYREQLEMRFGRSREVMRIVFRKARTNPKRVAFAEGEHPKIVQAAAQLVATKIARPVLIGDEYRIRAQASQLGLELEGVDIEDIRCSPARERYIQRIYELRCRKGVTLSEARELILNPNYYAAVMVEQGDCDVMISGIGYHYPVGLRPPLQIIGTAPEFGVAAGVYLIVTRQRTLFFRRRHCQHRLKCRAFGQSGSPNRAFGAKLRHRAPGGNVELLELWKCPSSPHPDCSGSGNNRQKARPHTYD